MRYAQQFSINYTTYNKEMMSQFAKASPKYLNGKWSVSQYGKKKLLFIFQSPCNFKPKVSAKIKKYALHTLLFVELFVGYIKNRKILLKLGCKFTKSCKNYFTLNYLQNYVGNFLDFRVLFTNIKYNLIHIGFTLKICMVTFLLVFFL